MNFLPNFHSSFHSLGCLQVHSKLFFLFKKGRPTQLVTNQAQEPTSHIWCPVGGLIFTLSQRLLLSCRAWTAQTPWLLQALASHKYMVVGEGGHKLCKPDFLKKALNLSSSSKKPFPPVVKYAATLVFCFVLRQAGAKALSRSGSLKLHVPFRLGNPRAKLAPLPTWYIFLMASAYFGTRQTLLCDGVLG